MSSGFCNYPGCVYIQSRGGQVRSRHRVPRDQQEKVAELLGIRLKQNQAPLVFCSAHFQKNALVLSKCRTRKLLDREVPFIELLKLPELDSERPPAHRRNGTITKLCQKDPETPNSRAATRSLSERAHERSLSSQVSKRGRPKKTEQPSEPKETDSGLPYTRLGRMRAELHKSETRVRELQDSLDRAVGVDDDQRDFQIAALKRQVEQLKEENLNLVSNNKMLAMDLAVYRHLMQLQVESQTLRSDESSTSREGSISAEAGESDQPGNPVASSSSTSSPSKPKKRRPGTLEEVIQRLTTLKKC